MWLTVCHRTTNHGLLMSFPSAILLFTHYARSFHHSYHISHRVKRNSMPDVPLTPREKRILRETSLGAFDNPLALDGAGPRPASPNTVDTNEDIPPPKPYLPPGFDLRKTLWVTIPIYVCGDRLLLFFFRCFHFLWSNHYLCMVGLPPRFPQVAWWRLSRVLPCWFRPGWQSVIKQIIAPWNNPPHLGIEPGPQRGQTVRYIHDRFSVYTLDKYSLC